MDAIESGRKVLRDAEAQLRGLIQEALSGQHYQAVRFLADLADGVTKLLGAHGPATKTVAFESSANPQPPREVDSRNRGSAWKQDSLPSARARYPRFVRDDGRLVKIGWSKKSRKEYEHRVPKEAVISFVRHLRDNVATGKIFDVAGLLPVRDTLGNEIPAYQVYVTLAWLREVGVLEKKGRDGYVLPSSSVATDSIDTLWELLPDRSA